eukprot:2049790-Rhodomonas_salina.1
MSIPRRWNVHWISLFRFFILLELSLSAVAEAPAPNAGTDDDPCKHTSGSGTEEDPYVFQVLANYLLSDTGYYTFPQCTGVRPVLQMEAGKHYKFDQGFTTPPSIANHMHPLGFAYYPDGSHKGKEELDPGVKPPGSDSTCANGDVKSCQSPMYYGGADGTTFLGGADGDDGFGLDWYVEQFRDWSERLWAKNKYS